MNAGERGADGGEFHTRDASDRARGGTPDDASGDMPGGAFGDEPGRTFGGASGNAPGGAPGRISGDAPGREPGDASGGISGRTSGGTLGDSAGPHRPESNPRAKDSPKSPSVVHAGDRAVGRLSWRGKDRVVAGVLDSGFLIADGRVLVRLQRVEPPLPDGEPADVWVEADSIGVASDDGCRPGTGSRPDIESRPHTEFRPDTGSRSDTEPRPDNEFRPDTGSRSETDSRPVTGAAAARFDVDGVPRPTLLLRSTMHELPGDQTRDYALRTLSVTLSQFVGDHGTRISLAPGPADMLEFTLVLEVPPAKGTDYLWRFRQATRPGTSAKTMWTPPAAPFAEAMLAGRDRAHAAHYVGQLPLWLTTRRFWSVFRRREGRLEHVVQFTLPEKLRRTLVRRFRLETV